MKIFGNLVARVFIACFFFALLPLIIHSIIIGNRDDRVFYRTNFQELSAVGEGLVHSFSFWQKEQLGIIEAYANGEPIPKGTAAFAFDSTFLCVRSTIPELVGRRDFLPAWLGKVFVERRLFFQEGEKLYAFERKGDLLVGVAIQTSTLLERLQLPPFKAQFSNENLLANDQLEETSLRVLKSIPFALRFPLPNTAFSLVVRSDLDLLAARERYGVFTPLIWGVWISVAIGAVVTLWLLIQMARPIAQLQEVMLVSSKGDLTRRYESARLGFEINTLGEQYNQMMGSLIENMEKAKELEIGRDVQQQLIPKALPEVSNLEIGAGFFPAKEVGGDFYDVFPLPEDQLLVVMADGAGKGISACLYSLLFRSHLRSQCVSCDNLFEAIQKANQLFIEDVGDSGNFVTAWIGVIDLKSGKLTYTNGGHPPALLFQEGQVTELSSEGVAFGVIPLETLEIREHQMVSGSPLLLYTDGVIEAHNQKGELYSRARLKKHFESHASLPPKDYVTQLLQEIERHALGTKAHDDIAILELCLSSSVVT